ncbi:cysteine desulfurase [Dyadobacter jejuensis]|uniref:cysteine desulfurase n=1 Tax=Dyadobacter jejuensis TaxID=1082580 RepID=A0A316AHE7_9BACT|nr:cysteine desulfurase family protein [Dyadobacter jejuensis]PWJ57123.1 cysteine desulfurase [Dyadobacter jejuensis]
MKKPIYFDHQATTPMDPRVLEAMVPYFTTHFGNSSSRNHFFGWEAQEAVEESKEHVAALIDAHPSEIIFTSGATEAVNLAIKGVLSANGAPAHIITCKTEHMAVLDTCAGLEKQGTEVTYLDVDQYGTIDIQELEAAIRPHTAIIVLMYANNETGTLQPISEVGTLARKHGIPFLCDATQAVGKLPLSVQAHAIDLLCFSGHKMYGPKGIGVLYKSSSTQALEPQITGGGQQAGLRSGTLNVPGIVGLARACTLSAELMPQESAYLKMIRDRFESQLTALGGVRINGHPYHRLPHCSNLTIDGVQGEEFALSLGSKLAFSQSAACHAVTSQPSHVLLAMGMAPEDVLRSFRFGFGRFNKEEEINLATDMLIAAIKKFRA